MVYRSLDSVLTFFHGKTSAKGKGYYNKLIQHDFVGAIYLLMDVLLLMQHWRKKKDRRIFTG